MLIWIHYQVGMRKFTVTTSVSTVSSTLKSMVWVSPVLLLSLLLLPDLSVPETEYTVMITFHIPSGPSTHQSQARLKYSGSIGQFDFYRIRNKIKCTVKHKNVQHFALKNLRDLLTSMHAPEMISARPTPADLTKSLMFLNSSLSSNNTCGNISRHSHTGYNMLWFQEFKLWAVKS